MTYINIYPEPDPSFFERYKQQWEQYAETDIALDDLIPHGVVRITAIGIDQFTLRVEYEVAPLIPASDDRVAREDPGQYVWVLTGKDNLGNNYEHGGGTTGPADDMQCTQGVESLLNPPAPDASWIDLFLESRDTTRTLRAKLPLSHVEPLNSSR